jgi:hypothetical protein
MDRILWKNKVPKLEGVLLDKVSQSNLLRQRETETGVRPSDRLQETETNLERDSRSPNLEGISDTIFNFDTPLRREGKE